MDRRHKERWNSRLVMVGLFWAFGGFLVAGLVGGKLFPAYASYFAWTAVAVSVAPIVLVSVIFALLLVAGVLVVRHPLWRIVALASAGCLVFSEFDLVPALAAVVAIAFVWLVSDAIRARHKPAAPQARVTPESLAWGPDR